MKILKDIEEIDVAADILTNIKESENKSEVVDMDVDTPETDINAAEALLGLQNIETLPSTVEKIEELPPQPPIVSQPQRKLKRTFMELDENPNKRIRKGGTRKHNKNSKKNLSKKNKKH